MQNGKVIRSNLIPALVWCILMHFYSIHHTLITYKHSPSWHKSHPRLLTLHWQLMCCKCNKDMRSYLCKKLGCKTACGFQSLRQADVSFVGCYDTWHVSCSLNWNFYPDEQSGCDLCHRREHCHLSGRYKLDWNYGMVAQYHARGEFGGAPISTVLNLQCD